jgi:hypothetical protein
MKAILITAVLGLEPAIFGAGVPLPADAAGPLGSASARGFLVRTAQAPQTNVVANSVIRASRQLNGTLVDTSGIPVPNEAIPGPGPDGSYTVDTVSFEKDGTTSMDLTDDTGAVLASFNTVPFPGISGMGGQTDNFNDEAAKPPVVTQFVDGIKQNDWTANQGLDNTRRTLLTQAIRFADGQGDERRIMWVNSIPIRSGKLSDLEMAALGGPSADKIPVTIGVVPPVAPQLNIGISGATVTISWSQNATGYTLQTTSTLTGPAWVEVPGGTANPFTVQKASGNQYFRLK